MLAMCLVALALAMPCLLGLPLAWSTGLPGRRGPGSVHICEELAHLLLALLLQDISFLGSRVPNGALSYDKASGDEVDVLIKCLPVAMLAVTELDALQPALAGAGLALGGMQHLNTSQCRSQASGAGKHGSDVSLGRQASLHSLQPTCPTHALTMCASQPHRAPGLGGAHRAGGAR